MTLRAFLEREFPGRRIYIWRQWHRTSSSYATTGRLL